ncbi:CPBP family intramembrane glutamic endopeptidase [Halopiger goleimassiliensis]|uniref:CPBP family intramembrane glutamic endopeptidase n=1 Tax=Halopiger goleimassiliensis TaxID=1293048 RepID=UPI0006780722|nr:CPBP family intramembrane glutamic endopeptidase [Halopiger goleimassiliensis]
MDVDTRSPSESPVRTFLVAIGLAIFGILVAELTTAPALLLEPGLLDAPGETSIPLRTLFFVLNFLGFVLAGGIYIAATDRDWSFVDLRVPTSRDWRYVLAGIVLSILFYLGVNVTITLLELPSAESQVIDFVGNDQTMILVMLAIVFLFNAPAEEFLFRNIVQKRLYAAFSRMQAVVGASLIFATIHLPTYLLYAESPLATLVSLSIVFGGSLVFGYVYAKTDNLLVPAAAHAVFNAIQFGLLYLAVEYDLEGVEPETTGALVDVLSAIGF